MTTATSLIPELDEIVRAGDPRRRAEAARRIGELFLQGAATAQRIVDFWKTRPTF
ncbi:hypothetical protein [Bradyrhizobium sp.]|uniref:hypothetical protein n=1 Tax=Bradyrhizobium sp. TaxID=376 RepID=UPI003C7073CC